MEFIGTVKKCGVCGREILVERVGKEIEATPTFVTCLGCVDKEGKERMKERKYCFDTRMVSG
jgi:hypothetical protein